MDGLKLMLVRYVDTEGKETGGHVVAADAVGAGPDELVLVATGSSARQTVATDKRPVRRRHHGHRRQLGNRRHDEIQEYQWLMVMVNSSDPFHQPLTINHSHETLRPGHRGHCAARSPRRFPAASPRRRLPCARSPRPRLRRPGPRRFCDHRRRDRGGPEGVPGLHRPAPRRPQPDHRGHPRRRCWKTRRRSPRPRTRRPKLGRFEDKILKNQLVAEKTPGTEHLVPESFTGDHGLTLCEPAPYGVIGAITPCTNPDVDDHQQLDRHDRGRATPWCSIRIRPPRAAPRRPSLC